MSPRLALLVALPALACSESYTGPGEPAFPLIPPANESNVPEDARTMYAEDAAQLALRYVETKWAPEDRDPELPAAVVAGFYNALLHVYNERHEARDSVADMFHIHAFPVASTHQLLVEVDPRVAWTEAWLRGDQVTGVREVDSLVVRYGLTITKVLTLAPIHTYVALNSAEPLDIPSLAARLLDIEGIEAADAIRFTGGGNDIESTVEPGLLRLAFSLGFGDCPAGCVGRHYWFFEVTEDGVARFRGTNGDPVPTFSVLKAPHPVRKR